jgi:hypothetical protein
MQKSNRRQFLESVAKSAGIVVAKISVAKIVSQLGASENDVNIP